MKNVKWPLIFLFVALVALTAFFYWQKTAKPKLPAKINLFYYNRRANAVLPVKRVIFTSHPIDDSIRLLIRGELSADEKQNGFVTEFPYSGFKLLSVELKNGRLSLKFSEILGFTSGGSFRVKTLALQIIKTALQFPGVKEVKLLPEELFQP